MFLGTGGQEARKLELTPTVLTEGFAPVKDKHYTDSPVSTTHPCRELQPCFDPELSCFGDPLMCIDWIMPLF